MGLKELWHSLVERATEEEQALAAAFHQHIEQLAEDLGINYTPQEYPKWVGDKIVNSKAEEDALLPAAAPVPGAADSVVVQPPAAPQPEPAPAADAVVASGVDPAVASAATGAAQ